MKYEHKIVLTPDEFEEAMIDFLKKKGIETSETWLNVKNNHKDETTNNEWWCCGSINGHAKCWTIELGWEQNKGE